jgi:hypothetical protein
MDIRAEHVDGEMFIFVDDTDNDEVELVVSNSVKGEGLTFSISVFTQSVYAGKGSIRLALTGLDKERFLGLLEALNQDSDDL